MYVYGNRDGYEKFQNNNKGIFVNKSSFDGSMKSTLSIVLINISFETS